MRDVPGYGTPDTLERPDSTFLLDDYELHVLFTPLSGYFSSFPRGTCNLLASHMYLTLEESHLLYSHCSIKQYYSESCCRINSTEALPRACHTVSEDFHVYWNALNIV